MMYGYLLWFNPERSFGFVRPDDADGSRKMNVFFHASVVADPLTQLVPGTRVEMVVIPPTGVNRRAIRMRVLNGEGVDG